MSTKITEEELTRIRSMKEEAAKDAPERGTSDMNGIIEVWRDGDPLLTIFTPHIDRDEALNAVWLAVPGVKADRVVVILDAHLARNPVNPNTGEDWGPGEMQQACEQDKMCSQGVISDCIIINDVSRDGDYQMLTLPYHINDTAKDEGWPAAVHWNESMDVWEVGDVAEVSGLVPDVLRRSFERELEEPPVPDGISDADVLAAGDAAVIARLAMEGYGVALGTSDKEHFELVQNLLNSLGHLQMEELVNGED